MKNLLLTFVLLFAMGVSAQTYSFKDYNWDEKNTAVTIPQKYASENEVVLSRINKVEVAVAGAAVKQFYLLHEKIFINSDDAIERNNKIYIPFNINEKVITNKVRVILKNGKVITLNQKDVKEEIDQERNMKYNFFAVNGLEKGAVIEKLFVLEEEPELKGKTITMQSNYPIASLDFSLIYPKHLEFKTKTYNGLTQQEVDTATVAGKMLIKIEEKDIPALQDDEKYSNWKAHVKRFRYKLEANYNTGAKNLSNYKEFATNIYERFNPAYDKKEQKAIADFAKQITRSSNVQEQIWNIEDKIKNTISYNRYAPSKDLVSAIIKSKQANQTDILKLYISMYKFFNIEHNMIITSDRFALYFDPEFESYENLNDLLFYFPTIKMYMTPTELEYRIPFFPSELASQNGLLIKSKTFGGVEMGIGEISFIDIASAEVTHDVMDIIIDFTKDFDNPLIHTRIAFGGYTAMNFQPLKDFMVPEQYQAVLKSIANNYTVETEYTTLKSENEGTSFVGKKPFVLDVTFNGKDLVQKAGNNYLFSIGQAIGRQSELYDEHKRMMPVEVDYPHAYTRTIKVLLPKDANITNLDKLVMDHKMQIAGKTEAAFTTNYKVTGNELVVTNSEFYNVVHYPLENFENYRQVINAAADFNKAVIIITK